MLKSKRIVWFLFLVITLIALGLEIKSIITSGIDDPVFDISVSISLLCSALTFVNKVFKN